MARQEVLITIRNRYRASSKQDKSRILDELAAVTGHHRKHGIRLLAQPGNGDRGCPSGFWGLSGAANRSPPPGVTGRRPVREF